MEYSKYDFSYMFFYSERPGTLAARRYTDDMPEEVKKRRLDRDRQASKPAVARKQHAGSW